MGRRKSSGNRRCVYIRRRRKYGNGEIVMKNNYPEVEQKYVAEEVETEEQLLDE